MFWFKNKFTTVRAELLKSVSDNEGFKNQPYIDVLVAKAPEQHGIPSDEFAIIEKHFNKLKVTIGIGLTNITKEEALKVTEMRLKAIRKQIIDNYPHIKNNDVLDILTELSFQLGFRGMMGFKKMLNAIKHEDYKEASKQMIDSKWYSQTPNRAKRLSDKMAII
jgi:lysozyme